MKEIKELAGVWIVVLALIVLTTLLGSCTKYLDAVPDSKLAVPRTLTDLQQLLENENMFEGAPAVGEFGSDDLYLPDELLAAENIILRNGYVWAKDIYQGDLSSDWMTMYKKIYSANVVLEGLSSIKSDNTNQDDSGAVKGWALFCRAHAFYDLQQVFGKPYDPSSASTDLGIPLKLSTNLEERVTRATVAATFDQITRDLVEAVTLLPPLPVTTNRGRPSKAAGYALLARTYLMMHNYAAALQAAQNSLDLYGNLFDYNQGNVTARLPFSPLIGEVLYNSTQINYNFWNWRVDRELYDSFASNDLRKVLFFTENATSRVVTFKGYYSASTVGFNGLATDEVYLMKAECQSRLGLDGAALETLNALLLTRFKRGTYVAATFANTSDVLTLILTERRKQCIFRNLRWADLRRLNQEPRFAKTITRVAAGITYQLPPNDVRYTLPIPDDEIRASGIEQNLR